MEEKITFYEINIGDWFLYRNNLFIKDTKHFAINLIEPEVDNDAWSSGLYKTIFQEGDFVTPISKTTAFKTIKNSMLGGNI